MKQQQYKVALNGTTQVQVPDFGTVLFNYQDRKNCNRKCFIACLHQAYQKYCYDRILFLFHKCIIFRNMWFQMLKFGYI